jgi:predicted Rossmann fold nucleotide-binding protein DprA/Smf involved in DNA uptake
MAAVAHVVVVVECHERGGSLHTVAAARARGVEVAAVAGSVRTSSAVGTNRLIADGATAVNGPSDVLVLLRQIAGGPAMPGAAVAPATCAGVDAGQGAGRGLEAVAGAVWGVLDRDPVLLETIVRRSGLAPGAVSLALEQLVASGIVCDDGGWWRRRG